MQYLPFLLNRLVELVLSVGGREDPVSLNRYVEILCDALPRCDIDGQIEVLRVLITVVRIEALAWWRRERNLWSGWRDPESKLAVLPERLMSRILRDSKMAPKGWAHISTRIAHSHPVVRIEAFATILSSAGFLSRRPLGVKTGQYVYAGKWGRVDPISTEALSSSRSPLPLPYNN